MEAHLTRRTGQIAVIGAGALALVLLILLALTLANKPAAPNQTVALTGQPTITAPPDVPTSKVQAPPPMSSAEVARATSSAIVPPTYTEVVHGPATYTAVAQRIATLSALTTQIAQQPRGLIREHDFGAWSYKAWREENGMVQASVGFDSSSVAGLQAYAAANRDLAAQLATGGDDIDVQVVFRRVLTPTEYLAWSASAGMDWYEYISFNATDTRGHGGSGSIVSDSSDPWPQGGVNRFLDTGRTAPYGPLTINGPFEVDGKIAANRLLTVANDPRVFVVDVTSYVISSELEAANVVMDWVNVDPPPIFSAMLALGLENFR